MMVISVLWPLFLDKVPFSTYAVIIQLDMLIGIGRILIIGLCFSLNGSDSFGSSILISTVVIGCFEN